MGILSLFSVSVCLSLTHTHSSWRLYNVLISKLVWVFRALFLQAAIWTPSVLFFTHTAAKPRGISGKF